MTDNDKPITPEQLAAFSMGWFEAQRDGVSEEELREIEHDLSGITSQAKQQCSCSGIMCTHSFGAAISVKNGLCESCAVSNGCGTTAAPDQHRPSRVFTDSEEAQVALASLPDGIDSQVIKNAIAQLSTYNHKSEAAVVRGLAEQLDRYRTQAAIMALVISKTPNVWLGSTVKVVLSAIDDMARDMDRVLQIAPVIGSSPEHDLTAISRPDGTTNALNDPTLQVIEWRDQQGVARFIYHPTSIDDGSTLTAYDEGGETVLWQVVDIDLEAAIQRVIDMAM